MTVTIQEFEKAIVEALEDVKGKEITVYDTTHLTPLFERVIIASASSGRQTRAMLSSVREAVRDLGEPVPLSEGEDNAEWIIADCGAIVVHIMQPMIRAYYRLEEIWGDKEVQVVTETSSASK